MGVERDTLLYWAAQHFLQLAYLLLFRIRAWGVERVPRRGGVLLAANHQSFLDPPAVGVVLPRQIGYMARSTLFQVPGLGALIRRLHAFPVARDRADLKAIRSAIAVLKAGNGLLLFPEGTRTPDGAMRPFKPGFALVAARARVPIVPVAVDGTFKAWPRHLWVPRAARVRVSFGEPLGPPADERAACIEAAAEVQRRVIALRAELRNRE